MIVRVVTPVSPLAAAARPLVRPGQHGAFVAEAPGFAFEGPSTSHALEGVRMAVKDVFELRGLRTGAGNPAWRDAQPVAAATAPAVSRLLSAGAAFVGRTVTDELTYSLAGINVHYGTPENPACATRIPGGSSSGSAVAVAGGHADLALGTDCGGSVRLPASYCGVWGMRPTHGRLPANGCFTLAHSFDTVGWFARDPGVLGAVFERLAHTTLASDEVAGEGETFVSGAIGALLDPPLREAWDADCAAGRFGPLQPLAATDDARLALPHWAAAFRTLQSAEVWLQHGGWFARHGASLGADVRRRFELAARVSPGEVAQAQRLRVQAAGVMARLLARPGAVILLPTVPSVAPRRDDPPARIDDVRMRSQQLLCIAGLAGLPQVSLPWLRLADGTGQAPVGLSVIGARGDDEGVLRAARRVHQRLQGAS